MKEPIKMPTSKMARLLSLASEMRESNTVDFLLNCYSFGNEECERLFSPFEEALNSLDLNKTIRHIASYQGRTI